MNPVSLYGTEAEVYRRVIEWLPEAVAVVDFNNRILLVNESFCKITGYSESEWQAIGAIDIIIPSELRHSFVDRLSRHRPEDFFELDTMAMRKDQSYFHVQLKCAPLKDDNNRITGRI